MNNLIQSFYTWYKHTIRNTKYRWLIVAGTLVYLVSPIDISPDFLPIVGWIDDGILATLLITEVSDIALTFLQNRKRSPNAQEDVAQTSDVITVDVQ